VYLPPGYAASTARYPVLYMHDGQNLFDTFTSYAGEWRVDETCELLIPAGEIEPVIVVGIENGPARITEYTPWPSAPYGGGGGDAYLTAIRDVLIPEVDRRYRTRAGRASRYLCGSSLGGLISAYAGYAYDDVFDRVAAVSPSYWWDDQHLVSFAQQQGRPTLLRFYQDMGTIENGSTSDSNGNGIDDYIESLRAMRDVALAQGFQSGVDFLSVEAPGHRHNEYYWSLRLPDLLRFLLGPPFTAAGDRSSGALSVAAIPNPAHDRARLEFTLPVAARVRLEILDLTGRRVRVIEDAELPAGPHTRRWTRGGEADRLPAGLYWVRLRAANAEAVTKLAVLD
jgi:predicted alpha/beta superfamily hydrolase